MVSGNVEPAAASSGQLPINSTQHIANANADTIADANDKGHVQPARESVTNDTNVMVDPVAEIKSEINAPTDSHALAHAQPEEAGLVHKTPETEATSDVGWKQQPHEFDESIVGDISNEDLWMLIRRFNKQIYHVRATPKAPLDNLDLNSVEDEEFSPDKLRSNIERFYINVVVGLTSLWKHIVRLRSWREKQRTAAFCAIYFAAWLLDMIVPTALIVLIVLILYPESRRILFPPAPIALVNTETGGVQKPMAGVLGSHDSLTGAPEHHRGEAVEQEASNLVSSVASVAVGSAARKHDPAVPEDAPMEDAVPDATDVAFTTADLQHSAQGGVASTKHDKTKKPMADAVWKKMKPLMHIIGEVTDTYERFGNALSPTPPFPRDRGRVRLAAVLGPLVLISCLTSAYVLVKLIGFVFGFVFFGDPILSKGAHYLNRRFPHWQKILELQNSILKGVPTNAQVAITLLRIGEVNGAPIPPPPLTSREEAPSRPASIHEDIPLDATHDEIEGAVKPDPTIIKHNTEVPLHEVKKKGFGAAILRFFRGTTATGVETKMAVDHAMAGLGSRNAKNHLGILPKKGHTATPSGPVDFKARYEGKRGAAVINYLDDEPILYFTPDLSTKFSRQKSDKIIFSIPVKEIQQLKKVGGMGWKGKLLVGWAEAEKEVIDGLQIVGKDPKQSFLLTAMKTRDELFNRLVAMGGQIWEKC